MPAGRALEWGPCSAETFVKEAGSFSTDLCGDGGRGEQVVLKKRMAVSSQWMTQVGGVSQGELFIW